MIATEGRRYTPVVDGFQIRDVTYVDGRVDEYPELYDIVKWNGDHCYTVATLKWNAHEPCFEFQSCGMRWFEAEPTERVIIMVKRFASMAHCWMEDAE